jgi:hypothetical protein
MCVFSAPKPPPPPPPPPPLTDPSDIETPELVDNEAQKRKKKGRSSLKTTGSDTALGGSYGGGSGLNIPN